MADANSDDGDDIAKVLVSRNWADWRQLRFREIGTYDVDSAISSMAKTIKSAMKEIENVITASKTVSLHSATTSPAPEVSQESIDDFTLDPPSVREGGYSRDRHRLISKEPYYVYTREFDEQIVAIDLSDPEEIKQLNSYFMRQVRRRKKDFAKQIVAFQKLITDKIFGRELIISLLLDNSGSLRGPKIVEIATWAFIVSEMLDAALVTNEVLGFTTRAWKGGQSRERWLQDGKPSNPGRLNDLRYLIYKSLDSTASDNSAGFSLMLREGLLKENVDGEAISWAYTRLSMQASPLKILLVISDGAPVDDSTLNQNPGNFLEKNLISCVRWIENQHDTRIFGIGVEFDVGRYYKNHISDSKLESIGSNILLALEKTTQ